MSTRLQLGIKRTGDIVLSLICLILLMIPFSIIALLIKLTSKGPVFFRQVRPGKNEKPFRIWKFRTMTHDPNREGPQPPPQPDDPSIERIGRILRASGIDELPQLINVLLGQMSLVGPRPTLLYRAAEFTSTQKRRFAMRPGIAGLALIQGRNNLLWEEKLELDRWYVDHWSLLLDLKILWKTPRILLRRKGVYMDPSESTATPKDKSV